MIKEDFKGICPDCGEKLHEGQHKFADGMYYVSSCKECGFKNETPLEEKRRIKHLKSK